QGLNHYVAARLIWNINTDVDLLLDELFTKYYGPAEEAMRNFWLAAERRYALTRPGTHAERAGNDPSFWTELEGYLKQAEQAVAAPGVPQRFKDRVTFLRDGMVYGKFAYDLDRLAPPRKKRDKK